MAQIMVKALRKTGLQLRPYMVINLRMTASAGGFKNKEVGVLVADTARGIDIDQLPLSTLIYQIFPKHTFIE
jgi:hypothetical protein